MSRMRVTKSASTKLPDCRKNGVHLFLRTYRTRHRRRTLEITRCLAVLLLALTPLGDARAAEDREFLYSLGYSLRFRLKERLRGFASSTYEETYAAGEFFGSQNEFDLDTGLFHDLYRLKLEKKPPAQDALEQLLVRYLRELERLVEWADAGGIKEAEA